MSKEQYDTLVSNLDDILDLAAKCDKHLQPTVVDWLCAALIADSGRMPDQLDYVLPVKEGVEEKPVADPTEESDWDFRTDLLRWNERFELSRRRFKDPEFAALLAFVVKRDGPNDLKNRPITKEHLEEACRAIDRPIPSQPGSTLSKAATMGLLDKAKGQAGYMLTPKGENRSRNLLKEQDKS